MSAPFPTAVKALQISSRGLFEGPFRSDSGIATKVMSGGGVQQRYGE